MKLAWLTDIHLNFLEPAVRKIFYQDISSTRADAVVISGDIAEAPTISATLTEMAQVLANPIYFVLGNHDYYQGSVAKVRRTITELAQENSFLHWLPESGLVHLGKDTVLVGEDCWADGRYGDYTNSRVVLNDSHMIVELRDGSMLGKYQLLDAMQKLADKDAMRLRKTLEIATLKHSPNRIIVLVHVPPFIESCMHEGEISGDDYLPFFASKVTGDVLLEVASLKPKTEFLVLCGHTHSRSCHKPLSNLTIKVGDAEYCKPQVEDIIDI